MKVRFFLISVLMFCLINIGNVFAAVPQNVQAFANSCAKEFLGAASISGPNSQNVYTITITRSATVRTDYVGKTFLKNAGNNNHNSTTYYISGAGASNEERYGQTWCTYCYDQNKTIVEHEWDASWSCNCESGITTRSAYEAKYSAAGWNVSWGSSSIEDLQHSCGNIAGTGDSNQQEDGKNCSWKKWNVTLTRTLTASGETQSDPPTYEEPTTETDPPGTIPPGTTPPGTTPPGTTTHTHNWTTDSNPCNHNYANQGSKATTDDLEFKSYMNNGQTDGQRKNSPYNLGKVVSFSLGGNCHIDGEVETPSETKYWSCNGYSKTYCSDYGCYSVKDERYCNESGSYTVYYPNEAKYTDTYNNITISFEGFTVDGKNKIIYSPSSKYNTGSKPDRGSAKFSEDYIITKLIPEKLKEDSTGLLYGTVTVKCDCGCKTNKYNVYFDLTPPKAEEEEAFDLMLTADPKNGGEVSIGEGSYGITVNEEVKMGESKSIHAKANDGYEFDAWYEADGEKYSEEANLSICMPGYDLTLIAKFVPVKYNVKVYSDGNGTVRFENEDIEGWEISANVSKGDDVTIISNPNEGFIVDYWERIKVYDDHISTPGLGNGNNLELTDIQEDYIIVVHFKPIGSIPNYGELELEAYPDNKGYVIGGTKYAIIGNTYPIWSYPFKGAEFYYWTENGYTEADITDLGQCDEIIMPNVEKHKLIAHFESLGWNTQYYLLEVESSGGGYVAINPEDDTSTRVHDALMSEIGAQHTIKAYPKPNYEFKYWIDLAGNIYGSSEYKVTITKSELFTAYFKYIGDPNPDPNIPGGTNRTYRLDVESAGGGTVRGDVEDAVPGEVYPIKAYPNDGHEFLYWADKDGFITDYSDIDLVKMPRKNVTLVAHFREIDGGRGNDEYYHLTVIPVPSDGGNAGKSDDYTPGQVIPNLWADPDEGYEFVGWYENNQLVSTVQYHPTIMMPYHDMTLTAVFKKDDGGNNDNSPFKILSIRDIRWQDYFAGGGNIGRNYLYVPSDAEAGTILVNEADLVSSYIDDKGYRDIVYGYAVEFELVTSGISKEDATLVVTPYLYNSNGNEITVPNLGAYEEVNSSDAGDRADFMISSEEEIVRVNDNPVIDNPIVTWRWVYYLPVSDEDLVVNNMYKGDLYDYLYKLTNGEDIVLKFDIDVKTKSGQSFDYIKVINHLNRSKWGGKTFTYRMDRTVLDDIYDDAIN